MSGHKLFEFDPLTESQAAVRVEATYSRQRFIEAQRQVAQTLTKHGIRTDAKKALDFADRLDRTTEGVRKQW